MRCMIPDKARQLSKLIWKQRVRENVLPALLAATLVAVLAGFALNATIRVEQTTCIFVRWMQGPNYDAGVSNMVFCDLADGRTITATAGLQWSPPLPGSQLKVQIEHLIFGARYRVLESGLGN
jgi:hypothetical protein